MTDELRDEAVRREELEADGNGRGGVAGAAL